MQNHTLRVVVENRKRARAIAIGLFEAGASHEQVCGSIPIVRFIAFQCMHSTISPLHISIMNIVILFF